MARPRPERSVRFILSLLACCCCAHGRCQASSSGPAHVTAVAQGTLTRQQHRQHAPHQQQALGRSSSSGTCFIPGGLSSPRAGAGRIRRSGGRSDGGHRRSNSGRSMVMNTTRTKRGVAGRPKSKNGVGKKVRRILEPASREEVRRGAYR